MASLVEAVTADGDPATVTFAVAPASGSLIVALQFQRSGTANASFIAPTGWSGTGVAIDAVLADTTYRRSCKLWYKIAGAGESTSYSFDDGTTNSKRVVAANFAVGAGETFGSVLATAQNDNGATSSSGNDITFATGTTSSQSGEKLIIGCVALKNDGTSSSITLDSWTTELLTSAIFQNGGANGRTAGLAYSQVNSTATHASTVQYDNSLGNTLGNMAGIAVFQITTSGGASSILRQMMNYEGG